MTYRMHLHAGVDDPGHRFHTLILHGLLKIIFAAGWSFRFAHSPFECVRLALYGRNPGCDDGFPR
jgi:hypothetical protein